MPVEVAPYKNWRYVALGVEPTADAETIERTYWALRDTYAARAENYSDFDSRRSLRLLEEAYESLRHDASGPQMHTRTPPAPARKRSNLEIELLVCLAVLATVFVAILVYSFRTEVMDIIGTVAAYAEALFHYLNTVM